MKIIGTKCEHSSIFSQRVSYLDTIQSKHLITPRLHCEIKLLKNMYMKNLYHIHILKLKDQF